MSTPLSIVLPPFSSYYGLLSLSVLSSILTTLVIIFRAGSGKHGALPPGPPRVPFLGNEHQIPKADGHFLFSKWAKRYGPLFSLRRLRNTTIVITDWKLMKMMLDRKGTLYSHRPPSLVADLITRGDHILMMQYSDTWRTVRKLIHQFFMESKCEKQHFKVQEAEANQMVHDFLVQPQNHMLHPKRFSNSITMSLVYGMRTPTVDNEYMTRLYHLMEKWSLVLETGATPPVDSWPLLKYIPEGLLGNWRKRAVECGNLMTCLYTEVLQKVEERRRQGIQRGSFMDDILDRQEKNCFDTHQLAFLGGTMMEGGSDTSSSLILAILQAMTEYPDVQKKAHAEIDAAIGDERSPRWSDFSNLPYINMIIKEAHRWRPILPLGVVHSPSEDDSVNGYHIPKQSTIILNIWGMHMDETRFQSPERFMPERYASYPELAPHYAASGDWEKRDHFGYGASRRICPGIHLAERNLFIAVAKLLWAFEFRKREGGLSDVSAETGSSQGFMHCVKDYDSDIRLRAEAKRATIMRELEEARTVFANFD